MTDKSVVLVIEKCFLLAVMIACIIILSLSLFLTDFANRVYRMNSMSLLNMNTAVINYLNYKVPV